MFKRVALLFCGLVFVLSGSQAQADSSEKYENFAKAAAFQLAEHFALNGTFSNTGNAIYLRISKYDEAFIQKTLEDLIAFCATQEGSKIATEATSHKIVDIFGVGGSLFFWQILGISALGTPSPWLVAGPVLTAAATAAISAKKALNLSFDYFLADANEPGFHSELRASNKPYVDSALLSSKNLTHFRASKTFQIFQKEFVAEMIQRGFKPASKTAFKQFFAKSQERAVTKAIFESYVNGSASPICKLWLL